MMRDLFLACLIALLAASSALAQTTLHFREGQAVDPEEVASILMNSDGQATRTRSIRLLADAPAGTPAAVTTVTEKVPSSLSLPVQFDFDSDAILPAAREQLDALAAGIRLMPASQTVVIEGHTDATGTPEYNQQLSRRRADAVKTYLVERAGIDGRRLRPVGFGELRPVTGSDPYAPENRRVQFRGS